MRNGNMTVRMSWWVAPIFVALMALGGCSLFKGSTSTLSPADATVTAIATQALGQSMCTPQLTFTTDNNQSRTGILGKTTITFMGTCWLAGRTVNMGIIDHSVDSKGAMQPVIKPLLSTNGTPESTTVQPDGTFTLQMPLTSALQQYVWDTRLPFVAQVDGFVEFAATSIQVTSS